MKKNKRILFLFITFSLLWIGAESDLYAQDIHYSQFNASPLNLNPAQTGLFDGDWRLAGNFRSQWSVIPVPYRTFSFSSDNRTKMKLKNAVFAWGVIGNNDKSGDSKLTTNQTALSLSYIRKLNKDSTHFISIGVQPGFTSKSFDINALTFDNQYNGDAYNSALSSGESFSKTKIHYFDMGAGIAYLWKKNQRQQANIGVSALHLNSPKQSFFDNNVLRLDVKTCVSGMVEFPVSAQVDLVPTMQYQKQGKFNETVAGMFGKYYLKPENGQTTAVSLGGFYRVKDAFIVVANMQYLNFNAGISYDVNTSKLIAATNRRGGFEMSLIYIFKLPQRFVAKKRVCPIYM
jgi:type IX secretion system PorP/SprF family membrane protein